jgi:hypothetical protein
MGTGRILFSWLQEIRPMMGERRVIAGGAVLWLQP